MAPTRASALKKFAAVGRPITGLIDFSAQPRASLRLIWHVLCLALALGDPLPYVECDTHPVPKKSSKKGRAPLLAEGLIRSAEEAGLRYVSDWKPEITRRRNRKGFFYLTADGTPCVTTVTPGRLSKTHLRLPKKVVAHPHYDKLLAFYCPTL
jgi:hypothetical protein